jgi:hypothetical protein
LTYIAADTCTAEPSVGALTDRRTSCAHQKFWRRYLGLDVLAKSRLSIINGDTTTDEEVTLHALTA